MIILRSDAINLGVNKYFTGKKCKRGHVCERLVSDCSCVECNKIKARKFYHENKEKILKRYAKRKEEYRKANKDKIAEYNREYQINNRESVNKNSRDSYARNREKQAERSRIYRVKNPEAGRERAARRRCKVKNRTPKWCGEFDSLFKSEIYSLSRVRSDETSIKWEVDHIIPIAGACVSGLHVWQNLQLIPECVNRTKGNKFTGDI